MTGWMGKILYIDLSSKEYQVLEPGEVVYHKFLGGRGLGARLLFKFLETPHTEPLSPQNTLVFSAGPLTATVVPTTGRMTLTTRSPLTGTIFDSNAGGYWGPALKGAGYDALVITGKAEILTRLEINENRIKFVDCQELTGWKNSRTWEHLSQKLPDYQHAYIGPAGENQVYFASVSVGENRTLGRGGMGAVLGSKNLKAVSLTGSRQPGVADRKRTEKIKEKSLTWLENSPLTASRLEEMGTSMLVNLINEAGVLPTRNFQETQFAGADSISGESLRNRMEASSGSCFNCPIACARKIVGPEGEQAGPEYETIGLLGSNLGISDPELIAKFNQLCNELGLDTISTGSVIACLMELVDRGYFDYQISFDSAEGLADLIEDIALRQGLGDRLARGSLRFAREAGYPELAMQVKGLDIPAFDPRGMKGQGLGYITSNRGACHLRANMLNIELLGLPERIDRFTEEGKAALLIQQQDLNAILDSLIVCKFTLFALAEGFYREMLEAVTGVDFPEEEFYSIGERIWNLEKIFNLAVGFKRCDDSLPPRFKAEGGSGPLAGEIFEEEKMLEDYYQKRGWNSSGIPEEETLDRLMLKSFKCYLSGSDIDDC